MSDDDNPRAARRPFDVIASDRSFSERLLLLWDLAIIALVSLNVALILFDALFAVGPLSNAFAGLWQGGHDWYESNIHANFVTIDLAFVAVFVVDVLAGWIMAIVQQRYYRWYFYPFARWYDVLGCIPVAGFRFLRVLRVITITVRLQRLGVIDIRNWAVYKTFMVYYDIVVEEISDRVVIRCCRARRMNCAAVVRNCRSAWCAKSSSRASSGWSIPPACTSRTPLPAPTRPTAKNCRPMSPTWSTTRSTTTRR